ncbi:hypothetical protein GCM10025869_05700 [Homoserinibacter gongjuensis]|uniref:dTDP-4-dehydrorhamnose reductase n=1 Tax=Homoserinibacter gongjuensis TaxID=1162968 RepID=A0ABQ6JP35_9MICO|nr:hypothetical protein GCM10025869_05700 [Homoserinibacter gongjuensis]
MTRYLIAGAGGMLGHDLQLVLAGREVRALGRGELDITDRDSVAGAVHDVDVVINAAAHTAVDDAESHEDEAYAINATGAGLLAAAAADAGARFVQVSTDYVFRGDANSPYPEDAPSTRSAPTDAPRRRASASCGRRIRVPTSCAPRGSTASTARASRARCCGSPPSARRCRS